MKIYTAKQLAQADQETLQRQHITALELMERATGLAFKEIHQDIEGEDQEIKIFCGVGNNGGDGLVIARKLIEKGYSVRVYITEYSHHYSDEFKANQKRLEKIYKGNITILKADSEFPDITTKDILIDAIFGAGLDRPLPQWIGHLIEQINAISPRIYAIDLPTGLFPGRPLNTDDKVLRAYQTITFQSPKLVFYLPDSAGCVGDLKVLNIGLDQEYLNSLEPQAILLSSNSIKKMIRERPQYSHKGTYGHALVVGGSYGMLGSVVLATRGALRSGAGKVTTLLPKAGYDIIQTSAPEAMVITSPDDRILSDFIPLSIEPDSICFGIGVGRNKRTALFFRSLMEFFQKPMVIDADGLNILAQRPQLKSLIPPQSILAPHPGELERLIGAWKDDFEKIKMVKDFVTQYNCILIVKGAHSLVVTPEELYINPTGNPGMATGGSGDVLAGLLAGLMAQGYSAKEAALLGVYLHGLAGDLAARESGEESLIAGDLIRNFGAAYKKIKENKL